MRSAIAHDSSSYPTPAATVGIWLGRAALALVLAMVFARSTVLEYLRDPFTISVGSASAARSQGPATTLVLDLLAALPALLVLARVMIDRSFTLRRSWGNLLLSAIVIWLAASVFRADDRFAAAVDAANICSALAILWATQQLVRSWRTLRIIAAVAFGVLLIYTAHGVIDRLVELPLRQENLKKNMPEMLKDLNIDPDSYQAERLMLKITNGELLGFSGSINTFAAVMVVAGIVAAGALIQRLKDKQEPTVAVFTLLLIAAAIPVMHWTDSRTAFATPFIAAILFVVVWLLGDSLNAHRRLALVSVLTLIGLGTTLLIYVGVTKGKLYQDSLNFRWRYWVGAWGVWRERPWVGVGWDGFSLHYLAHRLPIASEEPKDPHNFIVRAFCELGIAGGVPTLLAAGRAVWEMTWPTRLPAPIESTPLRRDGLSDLGRLAIVCIAGMALATVVSIDFSHLDWDAGIELLKRLLYACLAIIGGAMIMLRSMEHQQIEDRPAPWIRAAMVIAVMIFLVHNLIDFSMFESSAMYFAAMLAGACWGVGLPERAGESKGISFTRLSGAVLLWLAAAAGVVVPTIIAESSAADGDDAFRQSHFLTAATHYREAAERWPSNADYYYRAAMAVANAGQPDPRPVIEQLNAAVAANPMSPKYYRVRAGYVMSQKSPDADAVRSDYEAALRIDPNDVDIRLEYATMLARLNLPTEAKLQYERALSYDSQLDPAEPKRLSEKKVAEVRDVIRRLNGGAN